MKVKIILIVIAIAILGLFGETVTIFFDSRLWYYFQDFTKFIDLGVFGDKDFRGLNGYNFINVAFYILLATGGVIYAFSNKESRIVRFMFSIMLLNLVIGLPGLFFTGFSVFSILLILWKCYLIYVFYKTLIFFKENRQIEITTSEGGDPNLKIIVESTIWQRFFNWIVDTVILLLVFSTVFVKFLESNSTRSVLKSIETVFGDKLGLWIIFISIRLIYYVVTEFLLQASPAKFLSETRVVTENGERPDVMTVLTRTTSRFMPFEPFSFFSSQGWHDKWSKTYVVKEKRVGVNGNWYFLLIPVMLGLILTGFIMDDIVIHYKLSNLTKSNYNEKMEVLNDKFEKISVNSVIFLKDAGTEQGQNKIIYIKPEKITDNEVTFVKITPIKEEKIDNYGNKIEIVYNYRQKDIERAYNLQKDTLKRFVIKRKRLGKAILEFEKSPQYKKFGDPIYGVDVFDNGHSYFIENIDYYFGPNLILQSGSINYNNGKTSIGLINNGWPATIVSVKDNSNNNSGWNSEQNYIYQEGFCNIVSPKQDATEETDFSITLKDTLNKVHVFRIYAKGESNLDIEKVK